MLECVLLCVSRGINFDQSQVIARGNQGMRNRLASLPNQLIFSLIAHMEKVKINRLRVPKSGWFRFLCQGKSESFYPGRIDLQSHGTGRIFRICLSGTFPMKSKAESSVR